MIDLEYEMTFAVCLMQRSLPGVPMGGFAATDSVIHVIIPPKSGHAER